MALFKILSNMTNPSKSMPNEYHQGYCYFDKNTGRFWIDTTDTKEGRLQINSSFFGECKKLLDSTTGQYTISQANSQVKKVDCNGFVLTPGASIFIKFTETNTYLVSDLSLNVNNTGARVIKYRNADTTRAWMKEGYTYCFVYDGDCYQLVGDLDTTYSGMSAAEGKTGTNTTNRVISAATLKAIIDARGYTTNTGTVTQVSTGVGLTGGPITNSGTIKVKLRSETALTRDSVAATETASRVYPVVQDKSGYLAVNVPWTDNDHNTTYTLVQDATDGHKLTFTPSSGQATVITIPDNNTTYSQAAYNYLGLVKPAYSSSNAVTLTTAASTNTNAPTIAARTTTTGRYYAVEVDKNGVPFVNVPWTDNDHNTTYTLTQDASDGHKLTFTPSGGTAVTITIPDNNTTYNVAKYNYLGLMKPAYSSTGAVTLTTTAASNSDTPTISARTTTAQRYYAIEVDKNGIPFVNVPWVDNNTWRGIQNNLTSSSTTDSLSAAMGKKLNDEKVAKAGDTMSGNLTVQKSTADDTGFLINNTNKTQSLGFIVGGSSGNAGLYSYTKSKWITYIDSAGNVQLNGNANTANKTSAANITTTQNAIAKYSNTTGTFANSGVLIDNNNNLSVPGNITATGQLNLTGNAYLNNETYAEGITTNSLLVNGNTSFVQIPTAPTAAAGTSNTQLATTEFVTGAVQTVVGPMRFMGSLGGSGATITSLPTASSSNKGYTYKVIKDGTYGTITAKAGDTVISTGSDWVLIPSGDEPSGTVTSITLKAGGGITLDTDNTAITTSGIRTISHKDTSSVTNLAANGRTYVTGLTFDTYGHVTGYTTGTETVTDTDTHWTTHLYAGDGTAANKTTTNGNTKITVTDNSTVRNSITIKGSGTTSVTSDANGVITISSADSKTGTVTSITPGNGLLNGTTTNPITTSGTLNINYGTTTAKIGTTAAPGSATTVSRSDHVHAIDLATGDANGQVKIAGINVSVKGLGSNAFNSTAYLPLAGGTMTGDITFSKPTTAGQKRGFVFSGVTDSAGLYYLEPNLNDDGRMRFIMKDNDSDPIEMAWTLYRASGKEIPGEHVVHSFNARGYTLSPIVEADGTKNPISIIPSINNFGSVGTSSNKWADMYATTFHGALDGNAATATKLATARTIQTNLASTSSVSFDGSANIEPGVKGTLGIANGGTGATTAANARTNLGLGTMATETAANYLKLSGGTMTGALNTANNVWNAIGDDVQLGDINRAGSLGIQGKNGNTGLFFTTYNQTNKLSGGAIDWDGSKFTITGTVATSISGNAATATTATKLGTANIGGSNRGIYLNAGTPTALSWYPNNIGLSSGNTNNYPWHRIATTNLGTGSWVDKDAIIFIRSRYNGGKYGVLKISARANNATTNPKQSVDISATWIVRYGFAETDARIAKKGLSGESAQCDVYVKCGAYMRALVYLEEGSNNGWTLVASDEVNNTTTSDKKTSVEVYTDVSTTVGAITYDTVKDAVDGGNVSYAKTAGSVAWGNISSKPTTSISWGAGTTNGPTLTVTAAGSSSSAVAIPTASETASGAVTTGNQTFRGRKGFGYMSRYGKNDTGGATQWVADTYLFNGAGTQVGEFWYDIGNATNITRGQYSFRQFSPNSTADTATTGKHETYTLPNVTSGLTENKSYSILTSKNAVTVAQGGTGKTTAREGFHALTAGLTEGTADIDDDTVLISGNTNHATNDWYYRKGVHVYNYIKNKASGDWGINATSAGKWATARTLTIGNKGQSVDGSQNVSWTLHDILNGAQMGTSTTWQQYNPGVYYVASNAAFTGEGNPEDANGGLTPYRYGQLIVSRAGNGGVAQFYISHQDSGNSGRGIKYRSGWNSTYNAKWDTLLDSTNYTNYTVTKTGTGASGTWSISISGKAATAGVADSANSVAWSNVSSKPINFKAISTALGTTGWQQLEGMSSGTYLTISKPIDTVAWGTTAHSAQLLWGTGDTKGLIDTSYSTPLISFAGGNIGGSTNAAPKWYFKLSGTSGATYTFPTASKTLVATDGTGAAGTWGISITGNAGSATALKDRTNSTLTYSNYGASGLTAAGISWMTCWNGYELRAISKAETFNAVRDNGGDNRWVKKSGDTMTGDLAVSKANPHVYCSNSTTSCYAGLYSYQDGNHGIYSNGYWNGSAYTASGAWIIYRGTDGQAHSSLKLYGAVWNDYAEFRKDNIKEKDIQIPGKCVREVGDGTLALTTKRLERGCEIISDTFGFAIGQDEENGYNTPIASNGRVLAYPYESIEEFASHIGYPVCSGPDGTVSIMTDEEEEKYPSRIIGTISEIPNYEEWGTGKVKVNGRVWIRIK